MVRQSDTQKSGLAGEFFVAAELFKRNFQVSLTLGNAKSIDLFALSDRENKTYKIQVKTLRKPNCFPMQIQNVIQDHYYVFVLLNSPDKPVEYFMLSGKEIIANEKTLYCNGNGREPRVAVKMGPLRARYKDRWDLFGI
ncbi:MAG: hypothetical protein JW959_01415 [Pirellulales bacterium]|nr:hypothetical protein [Pirellulales bacterium]